MRTHAHAHTRAAGRLPGEAGWQNRGREDLPPAAGGVAGPDRAAQTGGAAAGERRLTNGDFLMAYSTQEVV